MEQLTIVPSQQVGDRTFIQVGKPTIPLSRVADISTLVQMG
ncbi:hypothetical protein CUZ56_01474 [Saezia sanguinis]|uniref:Uncharacterized protein n=1 Tax=Saezia sanguinis TaxID=1965230 RepID=A0A433SFP9_9BURK|nr:hypothetical protein CUZ56_01474 [Saezia sanguinis]